MKIRLSTVLEINNIVRTIIDNSDLKIDPLFKFKLLGIMKGLEAPVNNFETIRNDKIREYGEETEEGNVSISKEDSEAIEKFTKDLNDVIESDVEVNIEKLKASDVFDKGVPADYLVGLYPIIEG